MTIHAETKSMYDPIVDGIYPLDHESKVMRYVREEDKVIRVYDMSKTFGELVHTELVWVIKSWKRVLIVRTFKMEPGGGVMLSVDEDFRLAL